MGDLDQRSAPQPGATSAGGTATQAPAGPGKRTLTEGAGGAEGAPGVGKQSLTEQLSARSDLTADMLEVPSYSLSPGGTTTALPSPDSAGEVRIQAGRTEFSSTVQLRAGVTIGEGQEIQVGPTQTMVSSQRTGIYRRPDGAIAAEYTTGPGGRAMRDAGPSQREDGRAVPEPFYWEPRNLSDATRSQSIPWADQPEFTIPGRMGDAVLSETRGEDSFRTALSAKRGGTLVHLRTLQWAAPWAMQIQNSRATGGATTGSETSGPGAAPSTLSGPIPNDASHEWMRFTDVATARAAGWQTLVRYLGDARTQDRHAFQIMAEALLALNPTFTIGLRCDREYSSLGSDSVTLQATGNTPRQRQFNLRQGGSESLIFHLLDVFSIEQLDGQSRLQLDVTVGGVSSSTHGRVPWVYPWATSSEVAVPLDDHDYRNAYKLSGGVT